MASRAPHEAAFRALVRRLDGLPPADAKTLADAIAPQLAAWPAESRRVDLGPQSVLGPSAKRLAASARLQWITAGADRGVAELLGEMSAVEAIEIIPLDNDAAGWIALLPRSVRRVSLVASPPRRDAEAWAATTAKALERLDALEGISLMVGAATPHLANRVLERPLVSFDTRVAELADTTVLERLDPRTLRALHLQSIDGVPGAWTPGAIASALARFPELVELSCPWVEPTALEGLRSLERLSIMPVGWLDSSATDRLFTSLPATLRRLRVPGVSGDSTIPAFARCPLLHEMSWVGNKFSREGLRSLLACGALERLTSAELNGALERMEARALFEDGAPRQMRNLDLFCLGLGDATVRALAQAPPWIERLVALDVQGNGLSSKGLSVLLDALLERATELVALAVDDNRPGDQAYERLALLHERGVAIDVELPAPRTGGKAQRSSIVEPAAAVTAAWARLDAALAKSGTEVPGLAPAAETGLLTKAAHLPPSLRALYAAHDGGEEAEVLGLGSIVWWPLADVGAAALIDQDERKLAVFAAPIGAYMNEMLAPGERPAFDDELDAVLAVDTDTEEVILLGRRGHTDTVAEHLGAAMEAVAEALESGTRAIDENGRLVDVAALRREDPDTLSARGSRGGGR
jgi:hypothetical protein